MLKNGQNFLFFKFYTGSILFWSSKVCERGLLNVLKNYENLSMIHFLVNHFRTVYANGSEAKGSKLELTK